MRTTTKLCNLVVHDDMDQGREDRVNRRDTVFASGTAESADAAFVLAQRELWERIRKIPGAQMRGVEHSTSTYSRDETSLNTETFDVTTKRINVVLITLLASISVPIEENHHD